MYTCNGRSYLELGLNTSAAQWPCRAGSDGELAGLHVTERSAVHHLSANDTVIVILNNILHYMHRYAI